MRRYTICLLALAMLVFVGTGSARASIRQHKPADSLKIDTRPRSHTMFGIRTGMLFHSGLSIERSDGPEWHTDWNTGMTAGAFLELPSPQWTTAAVDLNIHRVQPENMPSSFDLADWMLDIGVVLKPSIRKIDPKYSVRPTLGISYGRLSGKANIVTATNFMVVKLGIETLYSFSKNAGFLVEAVMLAAPYGRASAKGPNSIIDNQPVRYNLTAGFRPMIRFGLAYR